ncbi:hypothetical protein [Ralstonia pickettii]|uniref:hypothetical protein n=1 Tax=Ralstonia pickettii TaxID=329 RepID=UPI001111EC87|nr:hypothetical protein [Ralstonia pickettii]
MGRLQSVGSLPTLVLLTIAVDGFHSLSTKTKSYMSNESTANTSNTQAWKSWVSTASTIAIIPLCYQAWNMGLVQGEKNAKAELAAQMSEVNNARAIAEKVASNCTTNLDAWKSAYEKALTDNKTLNQQLAANSTDTFLQNQIRELQAQINAHKKVGYSSTDPAVLALETRMQTMINKLQCHV